jgi:hypothetical protein
VQITVVQVVVMELHHLADCMAVVVQTVQEIAAS